MADDILLYRIALTLIPGVGNITAKTLVSYCGGVEAVFKAKKKDLLRIPGIGEKTAAAILQAEVMKRAEAEIMFIEKHKIQPLFYLDETYPYRLKECADAPIMLYYKGNANLNTKRIVAMVGTRNATPYGKSVCEAIIEGLAPYQPLILSGLAYGIDITAHRNALKYRLATVAVLGHGLDKIYPAQHRDTAKKMLTHGGLLTEFISGTQPDKENFPVRNRIVAGMADAVIVVETSLKGGAMITAEVANSYNREVFAVPGRLKDEYSKGCNYLIKTNKAALIESAEDIIAMLRWETTKERKPKQQKLLLELNNSEKSIANYLKTTPVAHIDEICAYTSLTPSEVATALLNLEFMGAIKSLPGKRYTLS